MITTLLDHLAAPADQVRHLPDQVSASETTYGEDKATITGTGNRTSGPVLRSGSPRLVIPEHGPADRHPAGPRVRRGSARQAPRALTLPDVRKCGI